MHSSRMKKWSRSAYGVLCLRMHVMPAMQQCFVFICYYRLSHITRRYSQRLPWSVQIWSALRKHKKLSCTLISSTLWTQTFAAERRLYISSHFSLPMISLWTFAWNDRWFEKSRKKHIFFVANSIFLGNLVEELPRIFSQRAAYIVAS